MTNLKNYFLLVLGIFAVSFVLVNESNAQTKKPSRKKTTIRKQIAKKSSKKTYNDAIQVSKTPTKFQISDKNVIPSQSQSGSGATNVANNCENCAGSYDSASNRNPVLDGKAVNLVKPAYPPAARAVGAKGEVKVQVVIDEEGNVISASAISGHPLLQPAAVAAARATKFSPTKLSGIPVKVSGIMVYNFQ
jgi:TonB family protein